MEGAAVGEDRQRRRRAEDLQARGQRRQPNRLARLGQAAARGAVSVFVSGLVEVMAELALRGKPIHDASSTRRSACGVSFTAETTTPSLKNVWSRV